VDLVYWKVRAIGVESAHVFYRRTLAYTHNIVVHLFIPTGIALTGDPEFDIFRASAPYATRRAVGLMGRQVTSRRAKNQSTIGL